MEKWYNMYSYWVFFLALLYKLNIIKFSILPSIILAIIGGAIVFFFKLYLNVPMSLQYILFPIILLHLIPLFLVPHKMNMSDIKKNLVLVVIYLLFLLVRNKNIFNIYTNVVHENGNIKLFFK